MTKIVDSTRRNFLTLAAVLGAVGLKPFRSFGQDQIPVRKIPGSLESLPVIGLGSSKAVAEIAAKGTEPLAAVLRMLVDYGGSVIDTWPRDAKNEEEVGKVLADSYLNEKLFVTTKVDQRGKEAGLAQFRLTQRLYEKEIIDLAQVFSLIDLDTQWSTLQDLKAAGDARFIGVTVSQYELYPDLENFLTKEKPDFIQLNYSITERRAEEKLLPMAQDLGIAVLINRPFMNGAYFRKLEGRVVPEWAAEFDCESWAQFSLKYILAHPAVTCILTETSNPKHMQENVLTAFGRYPDMMAREQMRTLINSV
tara:strand:+ start:138 stop:1061 length:924 start_codon:yes stop_codon:yes gene_type:complete